MDGLTDPASKFPMGRCAEKTVSEFKFTREAQDDLAMQSYERTINSIKNGRFKDEVVPIPNILAEDEEYKRYKKDKLRSLKSAFMEGGSVTAANSSKLNDGACAVSNPLELKQL